MILQEIDSLQASPLPMTIEFGTIHKRSFVHRPCKVEVAICRRLLSTGAGAERRLFG